MRWYVYAILVAAIAGFAVGRYLVGRAIDHAALDRERARIRTELQADFDLRAAEYRARIAILEEGIAAAERRAGRLEKTIADLVATIGGSGEESWEITEAIRRAVSFNIAAAGRIGGVEQRLRAVIDLLEEPEGDPVQPD